MLYVILIDLFLLSMSIAIVVVLISSYKKLSRSYLLLLISVLIATPFAGFKVFETYEREFKLSAVPDALHVTTISYSEEESWGGGPGGNEAGIRLYQLPQQIANEISQRDIEFFNNLPPNRNQKSRRRRGKYEAWTQTPVAETQHWKAKEGTKNLDIYDYVCRYGFCIDIEPAVVKVANELINSEGSYYAYGRIGLIVVSPSKRLVLYMYNG